MLYLKFIDLFNTAVNKSAAFDNEDCQPTFNETSGAYEWEEAFGTCGTQIKPIQIGNAEHIEISKSFYQR